MSTAQRTASTTLANSANRPSPVVLTMRPCWDGRPHFPRLPPDHKIGHAIRTTEMEHDDCGDRSRSGQEPFSRSWNRRERSCGSQTEDTAIGGIAVIFQTSAGARWNGSMPYFALLGA